ncbi:hypothetical protein EVAR_88337_1 [Eumeta japonica]|uniref:Uncharacterized protein n=1 Tax=Eumeta variegata TaxID=151549 RepID=A0A4C1Y802_EUMVA|nr:hypothetical protein EVAR_88337_1 [Eumeta japonica]
MSMIAAVDNPKAPITAHDIKCRVRRLIVCACAVRGNGRRGRDGQILYMLPTALRVLSELLNHPKPYYIARSAVRLGSGNLHGRKIPGHTTNRPSYVGFLPTKTTPSG